MSWLIRQIRSLGSQSKVYGVHAEHLLMWATKMREIILCTFAESLSYMLMLAGARKPKVIFTAPTYLQGGSDFASTPQGGYNKKNNSIGSLIMTLTFGGFFLFNNNLFSRSTESDLNNRNNVRNKSISPALVFSKSFPS